jgi:major membrane immunogen (membrane-anchored lipoprotein)
MGRSRELGLPEKFEQLIRTALEELVMVRKSVFLFFAAWALLLAASCAKTVYKDGEYTGRSSPDDTGAYGEVSLSVSGGRITGCRFVTWQKDGSIKDENYGKVNGEISNVDFYNKAQLAVRAMEQYARAFVEKQRVDKIDAVSGATIAYNQFAEAVDKALEAAK